MPRRQPNGPDHDAAVEAVVKGAALDTQLRSLWTLTIELFSFATITREIAIPTKEDPPPYMLSVRSFDELRRELPPARHFSCGP